MTVPPHTCHARGCTMLVPPERLMCGRHWKMVPPELQKAVWHHYRAGQCDDKDVTAEWHTAADAAIAYVATLEGLHSNQHVKRCGNCRHPSHFHEAGGKCLSRVEGNAWCPCQRMLV
jgi:hypothetical protein